MHFDEKDNKYPSNILARKTEFYQMCTTIVTKYYHFGRPDDFTNGVKPNLNRFLFLLMLTMLNITRYEVQRKIHLKI